VGLVAVAGFDTLFLTFHRLSFSNDFWLLDPRTDYLVMMFPQGFWFDATVLVATVTGAGALALTTLSGGYLLYRRWRGRALQTRRRDPLTCEPTSSVEPPLAD
jgi:integral membrane protein (TIGR01906 family)